MPNIVRKRLVQRAVVESTVVSYHRNDQHNDELLRFAPFAGSAPLVERAISTTQPVPKLKRLSGEGNACAGQTRK